MRYHEGPTQRLAPPRALSPGSKENKTTSGSAGRGLGTTGKKGKGSPSGSASSPRNWREVRSSNPERTDQIFVANKLATPGHQLGVRIATGSIGGGVATGGYYGGGYYGNNPWVCDPWGWNSWGSCSSWGWGWSWCAWSYPLYWSWYYPCWYAYSRPYYYADYCYYPVTAVVYSDPQVIYVGQDEYYEEPVGEAVISEPSGRIAAPAAADQSPLSIAAQRYLELGDRAFREGRYTDAVQFYAKAVEFAPDQGALYLVLADSLFAAGDYHYGAYGVRRALELDPSLVDSQIDKHSFYPNPEEFDAQLFALERYLGEHPGDRDARLVLALNYLFGGRRGDAERLLEGAIAVSIDAAEQLILASARASR